MISIALLDGLNRINQKTHHANCKLQHEHQIAIKYASVRFIHKNFFGRMSLFKTPLITDLDFNYPIL